MSKNAKFAICMFVCVVLGIILGTFTNESNITGTCFVMLGMLLFDSLEDWYSMVIILADEDLESIKNGEMVRATINGETIGIATQKWVDEMDKED